MAFDVDRFKYVSVTQGAADAFAEGSVATGIVPEDGMGWEITQIEVQFDSGLSLLAADYWIMLSLSRDTKLNVIGFDDNDCVTVFGMVGALTTSGTFQQEIVRTWTPPPGTVFVEPDIFVQIDSNGTGQALSAKMRIHYKLVKLSEVEILRLLQNA